jgi:quercetin dioxygenase-like cupin family protein
MSLDGVAVADVAAATLQGVPAWRTERQLQPDAWQRLNSLDSKSESPRLLLMAEQAFSGWRFVSFNETEVEKLPGKAHYWHCRPGMVKDTNLMFVRAQLPSGEAHKFHYHPKMEEILYVLSGAAEQWVENEKRMMKPGDSLYIPAGIVHGTYNTGSETLDFLAVLSPAKSEGPVTVEVADQEPWRSIRA